MFKSPLHHYVYVRKHELQININCWIWKKDNHFLCVRERIDEKLLTKTEKRAYEKYALKSHIP